MKFGGIPVEFVPPGMTAEEARRRRKRQIGTSTQDKLMGVGAIVLLLFLCAGSGWYYVGRGRAAEEAPAEVSQLEPAQLTATAGPPSSLIKSTPTPLIPTPLPSPLMVLAAISPLPTPSPLDFNLAMMGRITATNTPLPVSAAVLDRDPGPAPTATPTPAPTKSPYDYEVIGNEIRPSDLYSYVSGWIVEEDGVTPRPARVRLRFATGEMLFPRPNNRDVANGHYEFMASPGRYWLEVDNGRSPVVEVNIGDNERHEISFRSLVDKPLTTPARSIPWDEPAPARPRPPPAVVSPAIDYPYHSFLPLASKEPQTIIYLPMINGSLNE